LQQVLQLARPPLRIEGFDISHFQGSETVASLVVLWNARPRRGDYRRFRIRSEAGNDDFRSMAEVVGRRAARIASGEAPRPDLFLIDGGRGQLDAAVTALSRAGLEDIPAVGLAKRLEELYVPGHAQPLRLPRHSEALRLLQRLRDEAHRFAVTYHRKLRLARAHSSELRTLPGVGPGRERSLLLHFGSLSALQKAEAAEIGRVPGIGPQLALKIYQALRGREEAGTQPA
jgi:excinuclease ABC subunit C